MNTQIKPIDGFSLAQAKQIIEEGGAVAFPTETVYGLGANAFDTAAVENIFAVKGRPNDNPLIVHVHADYDISTLVERVPPYAKKLAERFLPGPLTMIYPSRGKVSPAVSCGLDTLAIRIPSHEGAQRFLKAVGLPIAAPSANLSKHVSPTAAEHVYRDLQGRIRLILDGGACRGGIESTVLDCTGGFPVVLRSGLVTREMIASIVGDCGECTAIREGEPARSPGMKYKHYSPDCRTAMFTRENRQKAFAFAREQKARGESVVILCEEDVAQGKEDVISLGRTEEEVAARLYGALRKAEQIASVLVVIAPDRRGGVMAGVMNRLEKACGSKYES